MEMADENSPAPSEFSQRVNILLVDDQPQDLMAAKAVLNDLGQNLVMARSGKDALRLLLSTNFAVIILDVQMPDMDGFETAALIRERDKSRFTPIIFLTAERISQAYEFKGYTVGAVDYLFKPVVPEILKSKVAVFVELAKKTALLESANRGLMKNIQERLSIMEALKTSEEQFRAVTETATDAIVSADNRGIIVYFNTAACRIFGYSAAEAIAQPLTLLMPERFHEAHMTGLARFLTTGKATIIGRTVELVGRKKDGTEIPLEVSLATWKVGGKQFFSSIMRDVSERKMLEKEILEISEREQRRMAQDLHDGLSQQLTGVTYMTRALIKGLPEKSDAARAAEKIEQLVNRAAEMAHGIAGGLFPVKLEANGLMSALQELAMDTEKIFNISCQFVCDLPVLLNDLSISTHLYRIAQEAVANAIKHGKPTHIWIGLTRQGSRIELLVEDDGHGFAKGPAHNGGMGLHIMKYRSQMIGAVVEVEQSARGGTLVRCLLPGANGSHADASAPDPAERKDRLKIKQKEGRKS